MRTLFPILLVGATFPFLATSQPMARGFGSSTVAPVPHAIAPSYGYPVQRGSNLMPSGTGRPLTGGASGINPGAYNRGGGGSYYGGRNYGGPSARSSRIRSNAWLTPYYYLYPPGYIDPLWGDSSYYGAPDQGDPGPDLAGPGPMSDPATQELALQVQRLAGVVSRLEQQDAGMQMGPMGGPMSGPMSAPPIQQAVPQSIPPTAQLAITLVLRDGKQIEVQNYAVMDKTFWDFTNQPPRKIPIANIDVPASVRVTEAKGGEFPPMGTQ